MINFPFSLSHITSYSITQSRENGRGCFTKASYQARSASPQLIPPFSLKNPRQPCSSYGMQMPPIQNQISASAFRASLLTFLWFFVLVVSASVRQPRSDIVQERKKKTVWTTGEGDAMHVAKHHRGRTETDETLNPRTKRHKTRERNINLSWVILNFFSQLNRNMQADINMRGEYRMRVE